MITITVEDVYEMMRCRFGDAWQPNAAQRDVIDGIVAYQDHLRPYGIRDSRNRVMHFLSQAAHETDAFKTLEEYASGAAYEGRADLGNTQPGDGVRYKGRGIFMLTGRYNYRTVGQRIGVPLEDHPTKAQEPETSVMTAGDYWNSRNINSVANEDHAWNVEQVTRKINGGMNGYQDRLAYFMAAGQVDWSGEDVTAPVPTDPEPEDPYPAAVMELFRQTGCQRIAERRGVYSLVYFRPDGL